MLIDTHAHIDFPQFDEDRGEVILEAWRAGVRTIIIPGVDGESIQRAVKIAEKYPHIWFAAGWHPHDADRLDPDLLAHACDHPKCVAIGEIGLDYYRNLSPKDAQEKAFCAQIEMALRKDRPVIIHVRDAWPESRAIIEKYPDLRGVFHGFSGDPDDLQWALARGFYIGFGGPVTFNNFKKGDIVRKVPAKRFLTETDCPYLAPQSRRGKRNEPSCIPEILAAIAKFARVPEKELENKISRNVPKLFGIPLPRSSSHGDVPKQSFSQNFLIDDNICKKIAGLAGEGRLCVEIGSGNGELTQYLAGKFDRLYAVEPDWDRHKKIMSCAPEAVILPQKIQAIDLRNLTDFERSPAVVIGNLPFNETSPILFHLLEHRKSIRRAIVMTQKEVADRLAANPGSKEYGIPSILLSLFFEITEEFRVSNKCFKPVPKVESTVLTLTPIENAPACDVDFESLRRVVRAAFAHRRKKVSNSLEHELPAIDVKMLLDAAGIDPDARAEQIAPEKYIDLAAEYCALKGGDL